MPKVPKYKLQPLNNVLSIGERIARIRKLNGLTQKDLAEKIGVKRYLISDYERGRLRLYDEMLARFALELGVSTDEILGIATKVERVEEISLRLVKRIKKIEQLPDSQQKTLLRTIDMVLNQVSQ